MADQKITQLTALTAPAGADLIHLIDDVAGTPTNKKVLLSDLLRNISVTAGETSAAKTPSDLRDIEGHVKRYGALGNGVADDTTAINDAIAVMNAGGGGEVIFEPGSTYKALSIAMKSNVTLNLNGAILSKNAGAVSTHIIDFTGTVSATTSVLTANVALGANDVLVTSATGFAVGDTVMLHDLTYKFGTTGRNQEINRIGAIVGLTITLQNRVIGSYVTASTATLSKLSAIENAGVKNGKLAITPGQDGGNVLMLLSYNCFLKNCLLSGMDDDAGLIVRQSAIIDIHGNTLRDGQNLPGGGFAYGVSVEASSHHIRVHDNHMENIRENVFTDNTRHSLFTGNTVHSCYDNGFNTHGSGCDSILISQNVITNSRSLGISVGFAADNAADTNITISDNEIIDSGTTAIQISGNADNTKDNDSIIVQGNTITGYGVRAVGDGIFYQRSNNGSVKNNTIDGKNGANATNGIQLNVATDNEVHGNKIKNQSNGFGITLNTSCDNTDVAFNNISNISSSNIRETGVASTGVTWRNNISDDTLLVSSNERREGNIWGTKFDENYGATAAVADGGTITHNCVGTPTLVVATGSVASEIVTVTAIAATTFTVAIKTDAGLAGTAQTIYWRVHV